jgi:hypothetical protein
MRSVFGWILPVCLLFLNSCNNKPNTLSAQGNCKGTVTYSILNKWKKISSSQDNETTTPDNLEYNYDVLMFEPGSVACMTHVYNKAAGTAAFKAIYAHEIDKRKLTIQYIAHEDSSMKNKSQDVTYSFSGQCENTQMSLTYDDGSIETYKLYSAGVEVSDCQLSE